jgi:hypothetical protein
MASIRIVELTSMTLEISRAGLPQTHKQGNLSSVCSSLMNTSFSTSIKIRDAPEGMTNLDEPEKGSEAQLSPSKSRLERRLSSQRCGKSAGHHPVITLWLTWILS